MNYITGRWGTSPPPRPYTPRMPHTRANAHADHRRGATSNPMPSPLRSCKRSGECDISVSGHVAVIICTYFKQPPPPQPPGNLYITCQPTGRVLQWCEQLYSHRIKRLIAWWVVASVDRDRTPFFHLKPYDRPYSSSMTPPPLETVMHYYTMVPTT